MCPQTPNQNLINLISSNNYNNKTVKKPIINIMKINQIIN